MSISAEIACFLYGFIISRGPPGVNNKTDTIWSQFGINGNKYYRLTYPGNIDIIQKKYHAVVGVIRNRRIFPWLKISSILHRRRIMAQL